MLTLQPFELIASSASEIGQLLLIDLCCILANTEHKKALYFYGY